MEHIKSVFVTGLTGFVGSNLARSLRARGIIVGGMGRGVSINDTNAPYFRGDLLTLDPDSLAQSIQGMDVVVHAAAVLPNSSGASDSDNEKMTANLLSAMKVAGVQEIVHISSSSVYGTRSGTRSESDQTLPINSYGESKLNCEQLIEHSVQLGELKRAQILRFANVFGAGMPDSNNFARLSSSIAKGRFIGLGHGENRKSFLHIDDAIVAIELSLDGSGSGITTLNVATGDLSVRELMAAIAQSQMVAAPRWISAFAPSTIGRLLQRLPITPLAAIGRSLSTFASDDVLDVSALGSQGFSPPPLPSRIEALFVQGPSADAGDLQ